MPVVRTFAPVVAGMAAMNYGRFVVYTVVGALAVGHRRHLGWAIFLGSVYPDAGKYLEYIVAADHRWSPSPRPIIHLLRERPANPGNATAGRLDR